MKRHGRPTVEPVAEAFMPAEFPGLIAPCPIVPVALRLSLRWRWNDCRCACYNRAVPYALLRDMPRDAWHKMARRRCA